MMRRRVLAALAAGAALAVVGVATTVTPTAAQDPAPVREQLSCTTDVEGYCTLPINAKHVQVTPKTRAKPWFLTVAEDAPLTLRATHHDGTPRANVKVYFYATIVEAAASPPAPTTTPPPPDPGDPDPAAWPSPANTGVPAGTQLARFVDYYVASTDGEVLDARHFGALEIRAQNVVVTDSQIDDTVVVEGGSLHIEDSTVGPARCGDPTWTPSGIVWDNYTAVRVHVRGHADGFMAAGPNITVRDSYVDICPYEGAHADGIQDFPRTENLIVDHTTFDLRDVGEPANGGLYINAGDQGQPVSKDVTLTDNLVMGDGVHAVYLWPGDGTWIVRGNRVVDGSWTAPFETGGRCSRVAEWADNDVVTFDMQAWEISGTVRDNAPCPN